MKSKAYWLGDKCPTCCGNGRLPARFDSHVVFTRLQDEGWKIEHRGALADCRKWVREYRKTFFGKSTMFQIVAPDGEVIKT